MGPPWTNIATRCEGVCGDPNHSRRSGDTQRLTHTTPVPPVGVTPHSVGARDGNHSSCVHDPLCSGSGWAHMAFGAAVERTPPWLTSPCATLSPLSQLCNSSNEAVAGKGWYAVSCMVLNLPQAREAFLAAGAFPAWISRGSWRSFRVGVCFVSVGFGQPKSLLPLPVEATCCSRFHELGCGRFGRRSHRLSTCWGGTAFLVCWCT